MTDLRKEFLQELKELLKKYNVSISFKVSDCSDTYGLYDERLTINHNTTGFRFTEWLSVDGWEIDSSSIEIE